MYFKSILIIVLSTNIIWASCLTQKEIVKIRDTSTRLNDCYGDVPNYIQCKTDKTNLEKVVCDKIDFILIFQYLSQINIYNYENTMKVEVNHKEFNIKNMNYWTKKYSKSKINIKKLCIDLKESVERESNIKFQIKKIDKDDIFL